VESQRDVDLSRDESCLDVKVSRPRRAGTSTSCVTSARELDRSTVTFRASEAGWRVCLVDRDHRHLGKALRDRAALLDLSAG
jgi:hypothetical protein